MGGSRVDEAPKIAPEIILESPEATLQFGRHCAALLPPQSTIALSGELGTGKTTFVQGMACALGIKEKVQSPTFTYLHIYQSSPLPLYHFDLYRLRSPSDFFALGFEEYYEQRGIVVIEWAERIEGTLPENTLYIQLSHEAGKRRARVASTIDQKLVQSILLWDY